MTYQKPGAWLFAVAALALPTVSLAQNPAATVTIDANANRHAINPNIYGVAYASTANLTDLNVPTNRYGGNNTTRYNWQLNADNRGSDYYFESIGDTSAVAGERGDTFFSNSKAGGAQSLLTIPILGWVAKLGSNRSKLASFSISKYGAQTGSDYWFSDAGNGIRASTNQAITGNDPNDANVQVNSTFQQNWVNALVSKWGKAASGGVKYYILDNEPSIWHGTHRDVHPTGATMEEIRDKTLDYAAKIKASDPTALVVGPEEWGWSGYLFSGYDQQYAPAHNWSSFPDKAAHGNMDYLPWLLDQLRQKNAATGQRLLDVFSVHYYPQGGEFGNDTSQAMQLRRNRSTRSLWDPNYVDETWIGTQVQLVPRLKNWVNQYYPGTLTAITEYNWGAEGHINGATTQADILGIFGREGLDMANRWTTPDPSTPTYKAIKLYRNYDGNKSAFGDTSVSTSVANPDNVSAFAATRTGDGALTVMVVNKYLSGSTPVTLNLANFANQGTAQVWQLTSANAINRLSDIAFSGSSVTTSVPAQSITLFVLPAGNNTSPAFTATAAASPTTVAPGGTVSIAFAVNCTKIGLTNGVVDLEIYDATGTRVVQRNWTGQNITAGGSIRYTYNWRTPTSGGVYTVKLGVFNSNSSANYYWNNAATTFTVGSLDSAQYNFEGSSQSWTSDGAPISGVASSTAKAYAGTGSLAVSFNGAAGQKQAFVLSPNVPAGKTVTFHIWIPAGSAVSAIQPYALQGASGGWAWTGNWQAISSLTPGAWNTVTITLPANAQPLYSLGVQFTTNATWTGTCYIDSVSW